MNAIKFENSRKGFTAEVVGMNFNLREINQPTEPALYAVWSIDYHDSFIGNLPEAREWLNQIIRNHNDSTAQ